MGIRGGDAGCVVTTLGTVLDQVSIWCWMEGSTPMVAAGRWDTMRYDDVCSGPVLGSLEITPT